MILKLVQSSVMSTKIQALSVFCFAIFCMLTIYLHASRWLPKRNPHALTQPCSTQECKVGTRGFHLVRFCLSYKKLIFRTPPINLSLCLIGYIWLKSESLVKENGTTQTLLRLTTMYAPGLRQEPTSLKSIDLCIRAKQNWEAVTAKYLVLLSSNYLVLQALLRVTQGNTNI